MATKLSHWMLNQSLVLFLWISKNLLISQSGQIHLEHLNVGTHTTLHLIHLHLGQRRMLLSYPRPKSPPGCPPRRPPPTTPWRSPRCTWTCRTPHSLSCNSASCTSDSGREIPHFLLLSRS